MGKKGLEWGKYLADEHEIEHLLAAVSECLVH